MMILSTFSRVLLLWRRHNNTDLGVIMKRYGILIKSGMQKQTQAALFDEHQGRMDVFVKEYRKNGNYGVQGALITYNLNAWRHYSIVEDLEIVAYPVSELRGDIAFLHHLLELILFFVPNDQQNSDLFELLQHLYQEENGYMFATRFTQQLFLCKFFALIGVYPEEAIYWHAAHVRRLILSPLEIMVKNADERTMSSLVQAWVLACIHSHPQVGLFKAVHCYSKQG